MLVLRRRLDAHEAREVVQRRYSYNHRKGTIGNKIQDALDDGVEPPEESLPLV